MKAKFRLPRSGMALCALLSGVALLAGAQTASADPTAHPAAGVLKLPNVRVEMASPAERAQASRAAAGSSQPAVRAYKDPETGELRDQTPEEMMLDGMSLTKSARGPAAKSVVMKPGGAFSIELDESFMTNAVVTRDGTGKAHMQCVTGDEAALRTVLEGKAAKGDRHDH